MFNSGHIVNRETGLTVNSSGIQREGTQSELAVNHTYIVNISAVSSLSGGRFWIEQYDRATDAWVAAPQEVCLLASGGGTPTVIEGNTGAATAVVGGRAANADGIRALSSTGTILLTAPGLGTKTRLSGSASSGSGTFSYAYVGQRVFS